MADEPGTTTTTTTLSKLPQVTSTSTTSTAPAINNAKTASAADSYKKALHQAILLKANSNNSMDTMQGLSSSLFNLPPVLTNLQSTMPTAPKWTNVSNLVTISNSSSSNNQMGFNLPSTTTTTAANKPSQHNSPTLVDTELDNTDLLGLATNELFSQLHDELNMACGSTPTENNNAQSTESDGEELDTPLNIKENINMSLRNLNQTLDPMRSSDDEENNANGLRSSSQDVIVIGSLLPNVVNPGNNNQVVKMAIPLNNNKASNSYVTKVAGSTNINIPVKLPAQPIKSINLSSVSLLSADNLNNLKNNNSQTRLAKRLKDEALSNSSSSDDESESQSPQSNQLENQPLAQRQKLCQTGLQNIKNDEAKLQQITMPANNKGSSRLTVNQIQQPKITPVVSQAERERQANNQEPAPSASMICPSPNYLNQSMESSTSDLTNTSYSSSSLSKYPCSSSQKSSQSSLDCPDLSFSCVASPTSCCSSSSANNDSAIDLHDDNSSTASGPIYIRQPGFEHHAHEVIEASSHPQLTFTSVPAVAVINSKSVNVKPVKVKKINEKSISYLTSNYNSLNALNTTTTTAASGSNNNVKASKAKKKLCMMINDTVQDSNTQLKPISNKAKREPLPMRLRALPPSFWQQPNLQPNVTPSSMYLPPLFKHMDLDCTSQMDNTGLDNVSIDSLTNTINNNNRTSSDTNLNAREVRISPANTDLLFKLFDQVDSPASSNSNAKLIGSTSKLGRLNMLNIKSNQSQQPVKTNNQCKNLIKGEDPCIVDSVTEGLFPLLRLDSLKAVNSQFEGQAAKTNSVNSTLTSNAMDCLSSNGLSNSSPVISSYSSNGSHHLPMLQFEQNYSQALSDVVAAL